MKSYISCIALLVAAALPASAGSISSNYTDTFSVTGAKAKTTVTASFTFNKTTDKMSGSLAFAGGVFNVTDPFSGTAACKGNICLFTISMTDSSKDKLSYTITLNLSNGQYGALGGISKGLNAGAFGGSGYAGYPSVPEGGSKLSYAAPAGLVIFGGILLSGFKRPRVRSQQSV